MERWSNENLEAKMLQLAEGGFAENAAQELEELNTNFAELCEHWAIQEEQEKVDKKGWSLQAEWLYFSLGKKYVMHLLNADNNKMETSSEQEINVSAAQRAPTETQKTVLMYRDYQRLVMPIIELGQINIVNEMTINEVLSAVQEALNQAEQLQYGLQESENAIMAIVYSKLDPVSKGIWDFQLSVQNPNLNGLIDFLVKRAAMLKGAPVEVASASTSTMPSAQSRQSTNPRGKFCIYCEVTSHNIFHCDYFDGLIIPAKERYLRDEGRCFNCFLRHSMEPCAQGECRKCNVKHNSMLCPKNPKNLGH